MKPSVGIILLNWNNADDTIECIHSLNKLDYPDYKIYVVDNGSTDDSVHKLEAQFPNLTILKSNTNLGFTRGNNLGIRRALDEEKDMIWILNNDVTIEKDALDRMVEKLESDPEFGLVGCTIKNMDEERSIQACGGGRVNYWTGQLIPFKNKVRDEALDYIAGTSMLVKSPVLREVGLLDERIFIYWEDVEYTQRLKRSGFKTGYAPGAVIYHAENASMAGLSLRREYLFSHGTAVFYKEYVSLWAVRLFISYLGKVVKRLFRGEFVNIGAVTIGFLDGMDESAEARPYRFN